MLTVNRWEISANHKHLQRGKESRTPPKRNMNPFLTRNISTPGESEAAKLGTKARGRDPDWAWPLLGAGIEELKPDAGGRRLQSAAIDKEAIIASTQKHGASVECVFRA